MGSEGEHTPAPRGDSFNTHPAQWAERQGFPSHVSGMWAVNRQTCDATAQSAPASNFLEGVPRTLPPLSSVGPQGAEIVDRWIEVARRALARCTKVESQNFVATRLKTLRHGDLSKWSKMSRPPPNHTGGYAPKWLYHEDGSRSRPSTPSEAIEASGQEFGALLREPASRWSHPLVRQWTDSASWPRGSLALSGRSPNFSSSLQDRLTRAFLGPRNCITVVDWWAADVTVCNGHVICVGGGASPQPTASTGVHAGRNHAQGSHERCYV